MGTEIHIVLENRLDETRLLALPHALNGYFARNAGQIRLRRFAIWDEPPEQAAYYEAIDSGWLKDQQPQEWTIDVNWTAVDQMRVIMDGPFALTLFVGDRCALVYSDIHWMNFVYDSRIQADLRDLSRLFCRFFGSSKVLYAPDDIEPCSDVFYYVEQGLDLTEILNRLAAVEKPAERLRDTIQIIPQGNHEYWSARSYFIEDLTA